MPRFDIDLSPVDHITIDAIGPKGKRVFYIQGTQEHQIVTLIAEKFQVQALSIAIEQFLEEVATRFSESPASSAEYQEDIMQIIPPVDPLCRVADIGLGYNAENDWAVLIIHELLPENIENLDDGSAQEPGIIRFSCTRAQLKALGHWGLEVTKRGRPICTQCGQPEEPEGHFCVKKNGGHKHS